MNPSAVFFRFRDSEPFLKQILRRVLVHGCGRAPLEVGGYKCVIVDATTLCGPGATGTDQRVHVVYDPAAQLPTLIEVTDAHGGESLSRHQFEPGTLILGDRAYGHTSGVIDALDRGCHVLVRFEFSSVRFLNESGRRIDPTTAAAEVPAFGTLELPVWLEGRDASLRAIGCRNGEGEVIWLLTDLDSDCLSSEAACAAYGWRWQIEIYFKRLKSQLDFSSLPSRAGPTTRPWIWAKLILASLSLLLTEERFSPWGFPTGNRYLEESCARNMGTMQSPTRAHPKTLSQEAPPSRPHTQARTLVEA